MIKKIIFYIVLVSLISFIFMVNYQKIKNLEDRVSHLEDIVSNIESEKDNLQSEIDEIKDHLNYR